MLFLISSHERDLQWKMAHEIYDIFQTTSIHDDPYVQ